MSEDIKDPGTEVQPEPKKDAGESQVPEWFNNPQEAWDAFQKVKGKSEDRFAKLEELQAQVNSLLAEKRIAEERQMQEQGQFKELAETRQATIQELENSLAAARIETAIVSAAYQHGFADPADAVALINKSQLTYEGGTVQGVADAVKALAEAKPHLLKAKRSPEVPDHNPAGQQKPDVRSWHPLTRDRGQAFGDGGVTYKGKDE